MCQRRNRDFRVQPDSAAMISFHNFPINQYDLEGNRQQNLISVENITKKKVEIAKYTER